ncbi:MAG TPA: hypothetical protein VGO45_10075 [Bacteroidia bacterium]|jgi:hypothetical protein|nr:hypothetical protein [Bacteroidia bacterium]
MRLRVVQGFSLLLFGISVVCVFFLRDRLAFAMAGYSTALLDGSDTATSEAYRNTTEIRKLIFRSGFLLVLINLLISFVAFRKKAFLPYRLTQVSLVLSAIVALTLLLFLVQGLMLGSVSV